MVKRAKSPETDTTGKMLAIVNAYPHPSCPSDEDKAVLVRWLAEFIKADWIFTIWHKPGSFSLIMVEIAKEAEEAAYLGEHRWAEFLKDPRPDEKDKVSRVFFAKLNTDRKAQKAGWKQQIVEGEWLKGFKRGRGRIKQPYPATHYCQPPAGDQTTEGLCCRLPVRVKPPPPPIKPPVPGSEEYVMQGSAGQQGTSATPGPNPRSGSTPAQQPTVAQSPAPAPITAPRPQTAPAVIEEAWPAIGKHVPAKKPQPMKQTGSQTSTAAGNDTGGKKKPVKLGLAQFAAPNKPNQNMQWSKVSNTAANNNGPIKSRDPPPSANPPKERVSAWGAVPFVKPAPVIPLKSYVPQNFAELNKTKSLVTDTTDQEEPPKTSAWGNYPSVFDRDWSSAKAKREREEARRNRNQQEEDDDDDDDLFSTVISAQGKEDAAGGKVEEKKDEYDAWAEPGDALASTTTTATASTAKSTAPETQKNKWDDVKPLPNWTDTTPQSEKYADIFSGEWEIQGLRRGRGRGRGNSFFKQDRKDFGGDGTDGAGSGGNAWTNRGRGRGRGAKPMFSNQQQRTNSWGNKGKQKATEADEEEGSGSGQNSGGHNSGYSTPGGRPAYGGHDTPPHLQDAGIAEGSSAGRMKNTNNPHDNSELFAAMFQGPETDEDILLGAVPIPLENGTEQPETPATPARMKTAQEIEEEYEQRYAEHCKLERRRIEKIKCDTHQIVCKKGVCMVIAKVWKVEMAKVDKTFQASHELMEIHYRRGRGERPSGWNMAEYGQGHGGGGRGHQNSNIVDGYQIAPSASDW